MSLSFSLSLSSNVPKLLPFLPTRPISQSPNYPSPTVPTIRAKKTMQGTVVGAGRDKTVAVEVTRLAPHPKYKRRVRKKKTYQAHDPDNRFSVGDLVLLDKCRPISKTKTFLAVPYVDLRRKKREEETAAAAAAAEEEDEEEDEEGTGELGIPLQSEQESGDGGAIV